MPLHLEDRLDAAQVTGSEPPADPPRTLEWHFDRSQPEWKPAPPWNPTIAAATVTATGDGLQVTLTDRTRNPNRMPVGGIFTDLPDLDPGEWADVVVRMRSPGSIMGAGAGFNLREGRGGPTDFPFPFWASDATPVIRDGAVKTYRMRADLGLPGPLRQLGLWFTTDGTPGSVDVLSVSLVPKAALFGGEPSGMRRLRVGKGIRQSLFMHAPGRLAWRVRVPQGGRLDAGLGVLRRNEPVTFRVLVESSRGRADTLFAETWADPGQWAQRSVDLSRFAGQAVNLVLQADAATPGMLAFWSAPTISGTRTAAGPNVIFYVIDGGGADFMSVYGYNRRTTPELERLAAEGTAFERAHSNSTWTKPSTASFMTSLQHSVLGPYLTEGDLLPDSVVTMAQHFHRAGYQTAVFTSNPNAGSVSGLERSVDVFHDDYVEPNSASSLPLQEMFFRWREAFPGEPYWVHIQTTDVHEPHHPVAPFRGRFVMPERVARFEQASRQVWSVDVDSSTSVVDETLRHVQMAGVDRLEYFDVMRGLYDETMAHQDWQLGRFVARLKESGEWEHTILVIAADHGHPAASFPRFGRMLMDSVPPEWEGAILGSFNTHVPLIVFGPGVPRGKRISTPVSMIDVLPTLLELAGLPQPAVKQGRSLVPLLRDQPAEPRPVIFDEFYVDPRTRHLRGNIEMIDGRWGASLEIAHMGERGELATSRRYQAPASGRWAYPPHRFDSIPRLLLYDLWEDPHAFHSVNALHPDLVLKYTELLEKQWEAHRLLATKFTPGGQVELTPEQLATLRALGYIR